LCFLSHVCQGLGLMLFLINFVNLRCDQTILPRAALPVHLSFFVLALCDILQRLSVLLISIELPLVFQRHSPWITRSLRPRCRNTSMSMRRLHDDRITLMLMFICCGARSCSALVCPGKASSRAQSRCTRVARARIQREYTT